MKRVRMNVGSLFSLSLVGVSAIGASALVTPANAGVVPIEPTDCSHCAPTATLPDGTVCRLADCAWWNDACLYACW